jgi:hypothetical protein
MLKNKSALKEITVASRKSKPASKNKKPAP